MDNPINKQVFDFLEQLKVNNNREWFNEHKPSYQQAHETMIGFADLLLAEMSRHDQLETPSGKKALFRIYRDVRFSKEKQPYKTHLSGRFARLGKELRGGYYFHIEPGNCFIASGFFSPEKDDLQRIREELEADASTMRKILDDAGLKSSFGHLQGEELKTAPKGFDKEHADIDLIRKKQFYLTKQYTDKEAKSSHFHEQVSSDFLNARAFLDYMSEVLTTDANGLPIE